MNKYIEKNCASRWAFTKKKVSKVDLDPIPTVKTRHLSFSMTQSRVVSGALLDTTP